MLKEEMVLRRVVYLRRRHLQLNYNRKRKTAWLTFLLESVFSIVWEEANCCVYTAPVVGGRGDPYLYRQKVRVFTLMKKKKKTQQPLSQRTDPAHRPRKEDTFFSIR